MVAGLLKFIDDAVPFGDVGVAVAVDKHHRSVVSVEMAEHVDSCAVEHSFAAKGAVDRLEMMVFYRYPFCRDSEAAPHRLFAEVTNAVVITPFGTIFLIIDFVGFAGLLLQFSPFFLLSFRVIPVTERDIEVVASKTCFYKSAVCFAGVGGDEDFSVGGDEADR